MALKNHPHALWKDFFLQKQQTRKKHEHEGKLYVQAIMDNFNEKFRDLVFNASELFSPKYYPIEEDTLFNMWEQWLKKLTSKFKLLKT